MSKRLIKILDRVWFISNCSAVLVLIIAAIVCVVHKEYVYSICCLGVAILNIISAVVNYNINIRSTHV